MELLQWMRTEFCISVADKESLPDNFDSVSRLSSFILRKTFSRHVRSEASVQPTEAVRS